jgi:hypothetical protein
LVSCGDCPTLLTVCVTGRSRNDPIITRTGFQGRGSPVRMFRTGSPFRRCHPTFAPDENTETRVSFLTDRSSCAGSTARLSQTEFVRPLRCYGTLSSDAWHWKAALFVSRCAQGDVLLHSNDILYWLELARSRLNDAEAFQRDYFLTGVDLFLEPYRTVVVFVQTPSNLRVR